MRSPKDILNRPAILITIFGAITALIIFSTYYELNQSKKELFELMTEESHSLLEMVLVSSEEVLHASNELEHEMQRRLLNNANAVKILLEKSKINNEILHRIAVENEINRINVFNNKGVRIFSSNLERIHGEPSIEYIQTYLGPIFNDVADTLIIGIKKARHEEGQRYVVAIASEQNEAIVLNLDAEEFLKYRKRIGFGVLIRRLTENKDVVYAALEGFDGIIAGSGLTEPLDIIENTPFLQNSMKDSVFAWRINTFGNNEVFEAVHPFALMGEIVGLYRIGLSLEPLDNINQRLNRRIIIYGIILFIFGSIMVALSFLRRNLDVVKKQYKSIETYLNKLAQNVSEGILVIDNKFVIKEINRAALTLLNLKYDEIINTEWKKISISEISTVDLLSKSRMYQCECEIGDKTKHLLISKSYFENEEDETIYVLIIKDLTEIKKLEHQVTRNERMNAMGELASGVAHEIRNPLNSIATIVQQLDKDFEPSENRDEYHTLSSIVYKEVKRINSTIENFLRFSKPEPIKKEAFVLGELIKSIELQYKSLLHNKDIELIISQSWDGEVNWDKSKIKQVLINLIQNSIDSIETYGVIQIDILKNQTEVHIEVADDGHGIPEPYQEKIFNLYFTTKASGTGIGLAIIQRIIHEHNGIITVLSQPKEGTTFKIQLPII